MIMIIIMTIVNNNSDDDKNNDNHNIDNYVLHPIFVNNQFIIHVAKDMS